MGVTSICCHNEDENVKVIAMPEHFFLDRIELGGQKGGVAMDGNVQAIGDASGPTWTSKASV